MTTCTLKRFPSVKEIMNIGMAPTLEDSIEEISKTLHSPNLDCDIGECIDMGKCVWLDGYAFPISWFKITS